MKRACWTTILTLTAFAGATPASGFTTDMTRLLRQLGGKPTPCPELEFKQLRLCATLKTPPGTLKKAVQAHAEFQPATKWTFVESMEWRPFQYQKKEAFVILSPLPGGLTVIEIGLGRFQP